jgi:hypothetical protein
LAPPGIRFFRLGQGQLRQFSKRSQEVDAFGSFATTATTTAAAATTTTTTTAAVAGRGFASWDCFVAIFPADARGGVGLF